MKNLKQLIKDLKLDYVNSNIIEENFPESGKREKVTKIFNFDRTMSTEEILEEIDKENYRPATIYELLEWGKKEWNGKDCVVALGSVWQDRRGDRYVAYLGHWDAERELDLYWIDFRWNDGCRFAAVLKYPLKSGSLDSLNSRILELEEDMKKIKKIINI